MNIKNLIQNDLEKICWNNLSAKEIVKNYDKHLKDENHKIQNCQICKHYDRIKYANSLKYPILVTIRPIKVGPYPYRQIRKYCIVDGNHRVAKAILEKHLTVKYKFIILTGYEQCKLKRIKS